MMTKQKGSSGKLKEHIIAKFLFDIYIEKIITRTFEIHGFIIRI